MAEITTTAVEHTYKYIYMLLYIYMLFPGKHVGLSMYGSIFFEMYMFVYICI